MVIKSKTRNCSPNFDNRKICFVAQNAYGAIMGGSRGHVGGIEHQTSIMSTWLAAKGYEASIVTWDEGQSAITTIDGIKVIKMCREDEGPPVFRFFHPRLVSLYSALRRADADIYYTNSADDVTGLTAVWCQANKRKFVYSVASDVACYAKLPAMHKVHERMLYRYALHHADRIIVQSAHQQKLFENEFGLNAIPLPMPYPEPAPDQCKETLPQKPPHVLWAGRLVNLKRLEWLLDSAERLPMVSFDVAVANINPSAYSEALYSRAQNIKNVIWHGTVQRKNMPELYRKALCLCCTSLYEGFPNTFLEAWSYGRPVISTFDPDGLITRLNLGTAKQDVEGLTQAIKILLNDYPVWLEKSQNAKRYFNENHRIDVAMPRFEKEFNQL